MPKNTNMENMHPKKKEYTYKDISSLYKFLISDDLTQVVQRMSIITSSVKSDHKAIQLCMNLNKSERGPETECKYIRGQDIPTTNKGTGQNV